MPPSPKKDTKLKRRGDVEDTFKTIGKLKQTNHRFGMFLLSGCGLGIYILVILSHCIDLTMARQHMSEIDMLV